MMHFRQIALALTVAAAVACSGGDEATSPTQNLQPEPGALVATAADAAPPTNAADFERDPTPSSLFLNELLFAPRADESAFVEIVNAGSRELTVAGLSLVSEPNRQLVLPEIVGPIAPAGRLLVRFDGADAVEPGVVHSAQKDFLATQAGTLTLVGQGGWRDRVAWGDGQRGAVYMGAGGRYTKPTEGTSLARVQNSPEESPGAWVAMPPGQASPGAQNLLPAVTALLPANGVIVLRTPPLTWYAVPGAQSYHIEVATNDAFTSLVLDQVVQARAGAALDQLMVQPNELPDGSYSWRVTAQWDGERASPPSPPANFRLDAALSVAQSTVLPVPPIYQRKDTHMLVVTRPFSLGLRRWRQVSESGGAYVWDRPYAGSGWEGPYCVRAAAVMLNRFFGGQLSQDRIAYAVHKDDAPGADEDLPLNGMNEAQIGKALDFALGGATELRANPQTHDGSLAGQTTEAFAAEFWVTLRREIAAGRPLVLANREHLWLAIGTVDGEGGLSGYWYLDGNFAAAREELFVSPGDLSKSIDAYWVLPASMDPPWDEDTIGTDADGDGIVDFDEAERFETAVRGRDSDDDGVDDKVEVRATLFAPEVGYGRSGGFLWDARDFDGDGKAMERDSDSDGDGCGDGFEDIDRDGVYEPTAGESWSFNIWDDACQCEFPGPNALAQLRWARVRGFARIDSPDGEEPGYFEVELDNANAKYVPEERSIVLGGVFSEGVARGSRRYSVKPTDRPAAFECAVLGRTTDLYVRGRISLGDEQQGPGKYELSVSTDFIDPPDWHVESPPAPDRQFCVSQPTISGFSAEGKACYTALSGTYVYSSSAAETTTPHASAPTLPGDGTGATFAWSFIVLPNQIPPEFAEFCDAFDEDSIVDGTQRLPADASALVLPLASRPRVQRALGEFIAAGETRLPAWGNFVSAAAEGEGLCRSLTDLWLTSGPEAETEYRHTRDRLEEFELQWIGQRDAYAASLRGSLNELAAAVEEEDKKIAADLRAMGVRLEQSGFESFARR